MISKNTHEKEYLAKINRLAALNIYENVSCPRKSSIICTVGVHSGKTEVLVQLRQAGMDIMRLNFSHGSYEFHGQLIKNLRDSYSIYPGNEVAIALDTKGPEIRTGINENEIDIELVKGQLIRLTSDVSYYKHGNNKMIYCDYVQLAKDTDIGSIIYIDDGLFSLKAVQKGSDWVDFEVQNSGLLGSRKGCNLPHFKVNLPALSEKDKLDIQFGIEQGVDMIFASFIRKASDIDEIRQCLGKKGENIKIIAKIENHEGVQNFDEILKCVDGVMVARGDLGIEIPPEKVFLAQKMMIAKCNLAGKPVICATQMLESMTYNPRPTRAEVSDVANAVLDGADCVMLSGETAKGKYPIEAVTMMSRVCIEAEAAFDYSTLFNDLRQFSYKNGEELTTNTIACAAVQASFEQKLSAIVVLSTSGASSRLISKYRPQCPIIMVTRNAQSARQAYLSRGVYPLLYPKEPILSFQDDVDERIRWACSIAKERNLLKKGNEIICVQGWKKGVGSTNTIRIITVE